MFTINRSTASRKFQRWRKTFSIFFHSSTVDASQTDIAEKDEEGNSIDQDEPDIGGEITPQSSEIMKPPQQPKKRLKKSDSIPDKEIAQAIQKLDEIANKSTEDQPYDLFGRYVASEMRQLPNRAAILLQQEIQNCITRCKLNTLDNESVQHQYDNFPSLQSPQSIASVCSSNEEEDILKRAMINTFANI
ncbi:hypothetical protein TNCV_314651 [Trichonephila clavipes]|nr:hypothetical protein TNCV_314651 [Trichonephila clavipes]